MIYNTIIKESAPPPVFEPETWVIKDQWIPFTAVSGATVSFNIKFKRGDSMESYSTFSNNNSRIFGPTGNKTQTNTLLYDTVEVSTCKRYGANPDEVESEPWGYWHWVSEDYRTITFTEESPSGQLLTWLQSNATKQ